MKEIFNRKQKKSALQICAVLLLSVIFIITGASYAEEITGFEPDNILGVGKVYSCAFRGNENELITGAYPDDSIWYRDFNTGKFVAPITKTQNTPDEIIFSRDKKYAMFLCMQNSVFSELWNMETNELSRTYRQPSYPSYCCFANFSPVANKLFSIDFNYNVFVENLDTGERELSFTEPLGYPLSGAFSSDGNYLFTTAFGYNYDKFNVVKLRDAGTGEVVWEYNSTEYPCYSSCRIDGTNKFMATNRQGRVFLWDTGSSVPLAKSYVGIADITYIKYSSVNQAAFISGRGIRNVQMISPNDLSLIKTFNTDGVIGNFCLTPDEKKLVIFETQQEGGYEHAKYSGSMYIYNIETGDLIKKTSAPVFDNLNTVSYDGKKVVSARARDIYIYDILKATGQKINLTASNYPHVRAVYISDDGMKIALIRHVQGGSDIGYGISFFDAVTGEMTKNIDIVTNPLQMPVCGDLSPDGSKFILVSFINGGTHKLEMYDTKTGELIREYPTSPSYTSIDFAPDGRKFAVFQFAWTGGFTKIFDAESTFEMMTFPTNRQNEGIVKFSKDSSHLFVGDRGNIEVYNIAEQKSVLSYNVGDTNGVKSAEFSPNGNNMIVKYSVDDGNYKYHSEGILFDLTKKEILKKFTLFGTPYEDSNIYPCSFSSDATALYTFGGTTMEVYSSGLDPQALPEPSAIFLQDGIAVQGKLFERSAEDYCTTAALGKNMLVEVEPDINTDTLWIFGKFGEFAAYDLYDKMTKTKNSNGKIQIFFSPTESGKYFFKLYAADINGSMCDYNITMRFLDRYLGDVTPPETGNAGITTFNAKGLNFISSMHFELRNSSSIVQATSENLEIISSTEAVFDFNLTGIAAGQYSLTAVWEPGREETLSNAIKISEGGAAEIEGEVVVSSPLRPSRIYSGILKFKNKGLVNAQAPLFRIRTDPSVEIKMPWMNAYQPSPILVFGADTIAPAGIISPGQTVEIPFQFKSPLNNTDFYLDVYEFGNDTVNWDLYKDMMKPASMDSAEWDDAWVLMKPRFGASWKTYLNLLGQYAEKIRRRGMSPNDMKSNLTLLLKETINADHAAVCGVLQNAATGIPLRNVMLKAVSKNGEITQIGYSSGFNGDFSINDLPDGEYEIYIEGYYMPEVPQIAITSQNDVYNQILRVYPVISKQVDDEEEGMPERNPAIVADSDGILHIAYEKGDSLQHTSWDGYTWNYPDNIANEAGKTPALAFSANLVNNNTEPGIFAVWVKKDSYPGTPHLNYAVGKFSGNSIDWSTSQTLTSDNYADYSPAAVINNNGDAVIVWLQRSMSVIDDPDVYYQTLDTSGFKSFMPHINNSIQKKKIPGLKTDSQDCINISFKEGDSLPKWVPIVGGKYGFEFAGSLCGVYDCNASLDGSLDLSLDISKNFNASGSVIASGVWKTDKKSCSYIFHSASAGVSLSGAAQYKTPPIPIVISGIPVGNAVVGGSIGCSLEALLNWKSNFPSMPTSGKATFTASAGPLGEIELLTGALGGAVSGTVNVPVEYTPPADLAFGQWYVKLEGEANAVWGIISKKWSKQWPEEEEEEEKGKLRLLPLVRKEDKGNSFRIYSAEKAGTITSSGTIEYVKNSAFNGTGSIYEGNSILSDISGDLKYDDVPAIAKGSDGTIAAAWAKESSDYSSAIGSRVICSLNNTGAWGTPEYIDTGYNFNKDVSIIYSSSNDLYAVWSQASASSVNVSSTAAEIVSAMNNSDIMLSKRSGGLWSLTPVKISALEGIDEAPCISVSVNGQLCITWINIDLSEKFNIYAVTSADGSTWSSPQKITESIIADRPKAAFMGEIPVVVWAQDNDDNINTYDDWKIKYSVYTNSAWSAPAQAVKSVFQIPVKNKNSGKSGYNGKQTDIDILRTAKSSDFIISENINSALNNMVAPPAQCCEEENVPEEIIPPEDKIKNLVKKQVVIIRPLDPNEKTASLGQDEYGTINKDEYITYTVYFENVSTASAAAQEVFVVDYLDQDLDWTTLRTTEVAFGEKTIPISETSSDFRIRESISGSSNYVCDISCTFDYATGRIQWIFRTIDPATEELPEDVYAGFLPPNDTTGRGEGHVRFILKPKPDLPEFTAIKNKATIVFDSESSITTNEVSNLVAAISIQNIKDCLLGKEIPVLKETLDVNKDGIIDISDFVSAISNINK